MINQIHYRTRAFVPLLLRLVIGFLFISAAVAPAPAETRRSKSTVRTPLKKRLSLSGKSKPAAPSTKDATQTRAVQPAIDKTFVSKIETVKKKVEVQRANDGDWKAATAKTELSSSDQIRTGRNSMARVKLGDGSKVVLMPNSQAEMENLSSLQKTIKLLRGRVRAVVAKIKGGNNFQVKTPIGVASVRGTDFEVSMSEDGKEMSVDVNEGTVGVSKLGDMAGEVVLHQGDRIKFGPEGEMGDPIKSGMVPLDQDTVRAEVTDTRVKDSIVAMAAEESRDADYQTGKSIIDVHGQRVRIEQYITRPRADQFKLVVLNERDNHFDYFTYKGTFNTTLPEDLSVALKEVNGKLGATKPDYYLTAYETLMSNTIDNITDTASGGHLVKIVISPDDSSKYRIYEEANPGHYRDVDIASLQSDGSYKIYNPIKDAFSLVSAAKKDEAVKLGILDIDTGDYKNFGLGDTFWKTRYDDYSSFVNTTGKLAYAVKTSAVHTLAIDLDSDFSNAPITALSELPDGADKQHQRLSVYYSDGSRLKYDNYLIDDEGNILSNSLFSGLTTSASYKDELEKHNYETHITATEMGSRYIDLVIDPKIATKSGLIQ